MTTPHPYTPEQTFARDLLIAAINGGINGRINLWARVHGDSIDVPADQVRAEGVDILHRAIRTVTLVEPQAAMNKLVADPHLYTSNDTPAGTNLERVQAAVATILATIRAAYAKPAAGVNPRERPTLLRGPDEPHQRTADVVVQVAVAGEVSY